LSRDSVSSVYRRMKWSARSTGLHSRLCLWHQYGSRCGARGKSRSKCGVSRADRAAAAALDRLRPTLAECERRWPGAWLEDKDRTLALHYRAIPEKEAEIRAAVERLAAKESGPLRLIAGKMVFELQPRHRHKGAVIAAFLAEPPFRGRRAVFIGDDTTDEDGFAEVNRRGGISIRVGAPARTAAVYDLASVADVLDWLDAAANG
jgi:trehalose 6-phosphate phosphatase